VESSGRASVRLHLDTCAREDIMQPAVLDADSVRRALTLRDLTDPGGGPHALQLLVAAVVAALRDGWRCEVRIRRASPIVSIADNYDRLHYPADGAARDARYTRYVSDSQLLRTQTSALIPAALRELAVDCTTAAPRTVLLVCPGMVYRRDCIDRLHTGEPHQVDLWLITSGSRLGPTDLEAMIARVVEALLPGRQWRAVPATHPYTEQGRQIDVAIGDGGTPGSDGEPWVEIGECGLALPALLQESGLAADRWSGLAMGIGLDRALMLRKGIDDIRLLRAEDPRVERQMLDLSPYRPVSSQPATRRDLSIAVDSDATAEELGDRVRAALGDRADRVESIEVVSETPCAALPAAAAARLGIGADQKNVLLRVVIRHPVRSLTHAEANELRDQIYGALHRGTVHHWACADPPPR
jgi:phenylalanyl-tRNA synthetase alpha chain